MKKGDTIEFTASRIRKGNPVVGKLLSHDDTWITVLLHKNIEGLVTIWYKGGEYTTRKAFIYGSIKTIKESK